MTELKASVVAVRDMAETEANAALRLMQAYYANVTASAFLRDLAEKQWIILLHDEDSLAGFSTQMVFEHTTQGQSVRVLFSGDTVINRRHWHSFALPLAWGRLMFRLVDEDPSRPLYWLLTTKGFRTYRFLPVFFKTFFPRAGTVIPAFELMRFPRFADIVVA